MILTILELIGLILGGGGLGALILQLVKVGSERRKNNAEATKTEDTIHFVRDQHFKESYTFLEERLQVINEAYSKLQDECVKDAEEYNQKIHEAQAEILRNRAELANVSVELNYYRGLCCSDITCQKRTLCKPFTKCPE